MDKFNLVKDGVIKLPPGFRFQPTDEEIVFQFLARKIFSYPLPASIISEINISHYDPWDLPGDSDEDRYFFSKKEAKYRHGSRVNRATSGGYWKATGLDKQVLCPKSRRVLPIMGMKKTLVFYKGNSPHEARTDWIMHEFRLVHLGNAEAPSFQLTDNSTRNSLIQMDSWVLCHIVLKKRIIIKTEGENTRPCKDDQATNAGMSTHSRFSEFIVRDLNVLGPTSSSSSSSSSSSLSDSSVITEVCSSELDHEETTSCQEV